MSPNSTTKMNSWGSTAQATEPDPVALPHKASPVSTQRVYDAICELHSLEQVATRETIVELTGLKLAIVDDRLRALIEADRVKRVIRGIYVPVEVHPVARTISKTVLPDGTVKIEIGDDVLTLTPKEDRALAMLQAGAATHATAIQASLQMLERSAEFQVVLDRMEKASRGFPFVGGEQC